MIFLAKQNNGAERDFIEYWAAEQQFVHGGNPYSQSAILRLERSAGQSSNVVQVSYSPPVALCLALPLGFVDADLGNVLWMLVLAASLLISIRILWILNGRPPNRLHLLGYCFAPVMACLIAGQLGIFFLLAVALFLLFHKTRPYWAGIVLMPCALKPHLFLPVAVTLVLWSFTRKEHRILAGFSIALLASCGLTLCFDPSVWMQYIRLMEKVKVMDVYVPTVSMTLRVLIDRSAEWLQLVPEAAACLWAAWYFWTRQDQWDWMDHGMLVLLISVVCAPYSWFTDESVVLPAVLAGVYRAENAGCSLLPFGIVAGVALIEITMKVPISSLFYLWTPLAWLTWYLYATWVARSAPVEVRTEPL